MKTACLFRLPGQILLLLSTALAQQFPSNPTRVLLSPQDPRIAYVLQPVSASGTQVSLSSLELSGTLNPSSLNLQTIYGSLPFLTEGSNAPWNAIIDSGGNITVYTGTCGSEGQIWKLNTEGKETDVGQWMQEGLSQDTSAGTGPQYLSSAMAFSSNASTTADDNEYYFFGGMCPWAGSDASNWQSNGQYSKNMVSLLPPVEDEQVQYQSGFATTRNLPIAQAGQSMTALQPTYSNHSDDSQTRQQDFVLLGGHTQAAFINMSQVALWSLPQAAWTYFPVAEGDAGRRTDLAVRQAQVQIEPRSGHTATLSTDGTRIVLLGGWVGDISTPAQPQIAILNVASEYGGTGDWSWSVPDVSSANGLQAGAGLYGHDAVMLDGDVMLIIGGFSIAATTSKARRQSQALSSRAYLLNITSGDWLPSYSVPAQDPVKEPSTSGPLSKTSQKAGLGVGLAFGAIALVALASFYLWYVRRNKRLQEEREKEVQELEYNPHPNQLDEWGMPPTMGHYSRVSHMDISGDRDMAAQQTNGGWRSTASHAERTGLLVELPSPTRGLRRNVSGKYPQDKRRSRNMEVIEENRDQESSRSSLDNGHSELQQRTATLLSESSQRDPFTDNANPLRNHPVYGSLESRQSVSERNQEVRGWVQDWEKAAEELMYAPEMSRRSDNEGRSSPSKSDRTTSMLSESSAQSSWSNRSAAPRPSGIVRTLSTRSAALLSSFAATLAGGPVSPIGEDARASLPSQQRRRGFSFTTSGAPSSPTRNRPDTASSTVRHDGDSYSTAQTSFAQLQAEGEALLGGNRSRGISEPSSPTKEKKNEGWYGNVKRVISGARTASMTANTVQYDRGERSGSSSPQKPGSSDGERVPPQRATSDASFLRSRRGAQDWRVEDEVEPAPLQRPSAPNGELEEDWDVERAVNDRVVQLMFTVPRQRLRIVNADDADARSVLSVDDRRR